jgi:hypothetical protein
MFSIQTEAKSLENTEKTYEISGVHTAYLNNDPQAQAEMLKKLGLFIGTGKGFELERSMTRSEAAVMVVRFLGMEQTVQAGGFIHPFTDVPQWADNYVGWLYENGVTKGVSDSKYGSTQEVTYWQYATLLSRAITGSDDFLASGVGRAEERDFFEKEGRFLRAGVVGLSVRALDCLYTKDPLYSTVVNFLVKKNVFSEEEFGGAAWGVLPSYYSIINGSLVRTISLVQVAKCPEPVTEISMESVNSGQDTLYAVRKAGEAVELLQIDKKALSVNEIVRYENKACERLDYIGIVKGRDYFIEIISDADAKLRCGALLYKDEEGLKTAISAEQLWEGELPFTYLYHSVRSEENLILPGKSHIFIVSAKGITDYEVAKGHNKIIYFDHRNVINQTVNEKETVISCVDLTREVVADRYTVPQDGYRELKHAEEELFYGQAGLYRLNGETGRLLQLSSRPVADIIRYEGDQRMILLSRAIGCYIPGMNGMGGDIIVQLQEDGSEQILLGNDPDHALAIAGFTTATADTVDFFTASDQGMQNFDIYRYRLLSDGSIWVTDFEAGRPEMMEGFSFEHLTDYKEAYMEKEQARLDALGY